MSEPVAITGNEARYSGGAIWTDGKVTLPATAEVSGNTALFVSAAAAAGAEEQLYLLLWGYHISGRVRLFLAGRLVNEE